MKGFEEFPGVAGRGSFLRIDEDETRGGAAAESIGAVLLSGLVFSSRSRKDILSVSDDSLFVFRGLVTP